MPFLRQINRKWKVFAGLRKLFFGNSQKQRGFLSEMLPPASKINQLSGLLLKVRFKNSGHRFFLPGRKSQNSHLEIKVWFPERSGLSPGRTAGRLSEAGRAGMAPRQVNRPGSRAAPQNKRKLARLQPVGTRRKNRGRKFRLATRKFGAHKDAPQSRTSENGKFWRTAKKRGKSVCSQESRKNQRQKNRPTGRRFHFRRDALWMRQNPENGRRQKSLRPGYRERLITENRQFNQFIQ